MRVVLDDQQNGVAGFEVEPVVRKLLDDALLRRGRLRRGNAVLRRHCTTRRHTVGPEYFSGR